MVDDLSLLDISSNEEQDAIKAITLVESCPMDEQIVKIEESQGLPKTENIVVLVEKSPVSKSVFRYTNSKYSSWIESDLETHINTKHNGNKINMVESLIVREQGDLEKIEDLSCRICELEARDPEELKEHMNLLHTTGNKEHCERCGFVANSGKDFSTHSQTCHKTLQVDIKKIGKVEITIDCEQCEYKCRLNKQFKKHNSLKHIEQKEDHPVKCSICILQFVTIDELKVHMEHEHTMKEIEPTKELSSEQFPCNGCGLVFTTSDLLQRHVTHYHSQNCRYCKHKAQNDEELQCHMVEEHEDIILLHSMAKQVDGIEGEIAKQETFKAELSQILKSLFENQEKLDKKLSLVLKCIGNPMVAQPTHTETTKTDTPQPSSPPPQPTLQSLVLSPSSSPTSSPTTSAKQHQRRRKKTKYLQKSKILYVGDSVAQNANVPFLEKESNTRIRTKKAYSAVNDKAARFPNESFADVVPAALAETHHDDQYSHLVLAAPTIDVTNIDASEVSIDDNIEVYKQKIQISCENMFSVATKALENHQELEKVILMEHPPRHDPKSNDPTGLKPYLANFANSTLQKLLQRSTMNNKIIVGKHNLDFSQNMTTAIFEHDWRGNFDGVHMHGSFGTSMFTESVLNIFRSAFSCETTCSASHTNCEQAKYQRNRHSATSQPKLNKFSLPIRNRFEVLGN